MPQFEVPLEGGGSMTVNASDYGAAVANVESTGNTPAGNQSGSSGGDGGGGAMSQVNPGAVGQNEYGDDLFQTPNGIKTGTQIMQELAAAGWDGQGDPVQVYNAVSGAAQSGGAGPAATTAATTTVNNNANAEEIRRLGQQINTLLNAVGTGNAKAFEEAVRQFNLSFGLDQNKFTEAIRQFNANLGIAEAGLTGAYQGAPTLPAMTGYAEQFGMWGVPQQGQQTLAAQQQAYAQQLGAITTAAGLQANPFRQAQVIGQLGGLLRGGGVAGFQAPGQAQGQTDFSGMGNMQRLIDDIRGGPGAINAQSTQSVLDAIPTPTKLDSVSFARSSPLTQSLVLQGMQEKYGLSPEDSLAQIKNTLPQFQAPTTFGGIRR